MTAMAPPARRLAAAVVLALVLVLVARLAWPEPKVSPDAPLDPTVALRLTAWEEAAEVPLGVEGAWRLRDEEGVVLQEGYQLEGWLRADATGVQVGPYLTGRDRVRIEPAGDLALVVGDDRCPGVLDVGVVRDRDGPLGLTLVLELPLEDYVVGVVSAELSSGAPGIAAALEAQAVAARTWALWTLRRRGGPLRADPRDQAFAGAQRWTTAARDAVRATRGQVLTWNGDLLPAFFHAWCGGGTADAADMRFLDHDLPPLSGTADPECRDAERAWVEVVSAERLDRLARRLALGDWLRSIHAVDRDPHGRVLRFRLVGSERHLEVSGEELRARLGLPSSLWLSADLRPDGALVVRGRGRGHGIGLCQVGALRRARAGWDRDAILAHDYPGAVVAPASPAALRP